MSFSRKKGERYLDKVRTFYFDIFIIKLDHFSFWTDIWNPNLPTYFFLNGEERNQPMKIWVWVKNAASQLTQPFCMNFLCSPLKWRINYSHCCNDHTLWAHLHMHLWPFGSTKWRRGNSLYCAVCMAYGYFLLLWSTLLQQRSCNIMVFARGCYVAVVCCYRVVASHVDAPCENYPCTRYLHSTVPSSQAFLWCFKEPSSTRNVNMPFRIFLF